MQAHVKAILGHNMFDHVGYVILSPKIILLDIYNHLVCILISINQLHLNTILASVAFDYLRYRLFNKYNLLWYLVIRHKYDRPLRSAKEVNDLTRLLGQMLVTMVYVFNQSIKHDAYLLCKYVNHVVITFIHFSPHGLEGTSG